MSSAVTSRFLTAVKVSFSKFVCSCWTISWNQLPTGFKMNLESSQRWLLINHLHGLSCPLRWHLRLLCPDTQWICGPNIMKESTDHFPFFWQPLSLWVFFEFKKLWINIIYKYICYVLVSKLQTTVNDCLNVQWICSESQARLTCFSSSLVWSFSAIALDWIHETGHHMA